MSRKRLLQRVSALLLIGSLSSAALVAQADMAPNAQTLVQAAATNVFLPVIAKLEATGTVFEVNTIADGTDAKSGDGKCETATGNGVCTLRAAIREANSADGKDTIILPAGVYTLTLPGPEHGDIDLQKQLEIVGAGANTTTIRATDGLNERVFDVNATATVTISGVTINNGKAVNGDGGGIYNKGNLTLSGVVITGNQSTRTSLQLRGDGGGIRNTGTLTIVNSTVSNNSGADDAGGILNNGVLTMVNVTVANNRALGDLNASGGGSGGGVANESNSSSPEGGAVATITNSTIAFNNAQNSGGGVRNRGVMTLKNTIVANNTSSTSSINCNGTIISTGGNVEFGDSCKFRTAGDRPNTDPLLRPLSNNGGPTPTIALPAGSEAIDSGVNEGCPATDQRGAPRPIDGRGNGSAVCDSGAFEFP